MKKLSILVTLILLTVLVSGCSMKAFEANEDTVYVRDKGTVTGVIVEDFDKEYYDEEELELLINEEIAAYNENAGEGSIEIDKYEVKDQVVKVYMNYKTGSDYSEFNGVTFFSGSMAEAIAADYDFDVDFLDENDEKISVEKVLKNESYHVIILEETIALQIDSAILYHSGNTVVKENNKVHVSEETEDLAYIIYK